MLIYYKTCLSWETSGGDNLIGEFAGTLFHDIGGWGGVSGNIGTPGNAK